MFKARRGWSVHPKRVRVTPAVYPARGHAAPVGRGARPRRALGRARRAGRDEPMRASVRATVLDRPAAAGLREYLQSAERSRAAGGEAVGRRGCPRRASRRARRADRDEPKRGSVRATVLDRPAAAGLRKILQGAGRARPDLENICKVLSGRARPAARPSVAWLARDVRWNGLVEPVEMSRCAAPCERRFSTGRRRPDLENFSKCGRGWRPASVYRGRRLRRGIWRPLVRTWKNFQSAERARARARSAARPSVAEAGRDMRWNGLVEPVEMSPCAAPCGRRFSIGRRRPDLENFRRCAGRSRAAGGEAVGRRACPRRALERARRAGRDEPMRGSVRATVLDRPAAAGLRKFSKMRWTVARGRRRGRRSQGLPETCVVTGSPSRSR